MALVIVDLFWKLQEWIKGKQKEKVNNMVLFDKATYDKLLSEAPKFKLITPSILSDRLRVFSNPSKKYSIVTHLRFHDVISSSVSKI